MLSMYTTTLSCKSKSLFILFAATLFSLGFIQNAQAVTITAKTGSTSWSSTASWTPARIPNSTDEVLIPSGVNLTITTSAVCGSLTIGTTDSIATTLTLGTGGALNVTTANGGSGNVIINPEGVNAAM